MIIDRTNRLAKIRISANAMTRSMMNRLTPLTSGLGTTFQMLFREVLSWVMMVVARNRIRPRLMTVAMIPDAG